MHQITGAIADRYRLEREIGQGGMATVFLAHDVKHDRKVAVKIVHPELAAVLGAERFLAEIRVTASLQHPHILPLFDSGQIDGQLFYVMPYVQGESLRSRLERDQQLPVDDALRITREVASALDYAHRHGVIHRDIKPENILLQDGTALVADFGIALAVSSAGGQRLTQTGLSLGTPAYMSPEQATGERTISARSDVYSLGAVLYEMLLGEPPFRGATAQAILAKVITERPPALTVHRETVPPHVEAAVLKSLSKIPADRFATAHDFAAALAGQPGMMSMTDGTSAMRSVSGARPNADGDATPGGRASSRVAQMLPWGVAAVFAFATAVLAWRVASAPDVAPRRPIRFVTELRAADSLVLDYQRVALSPDGSRIVVEAGNRGRVRLYSRRLDGDAFDSIPGTEAGGGASFSPDGRWIAFNANKKLMKVRAEGGRPIEITDAAFSLGAWGDDNTIIYTPDYNTGLWRVPADGGKSDSLTSPDATRGELGHWHPHRLPDGDGILFTVFSTPASRSRIEVYSLSTGKRKVVIEGGVFAKYVPTGHLLFLRGEVLFAAPFDLAKREVTGRAMPVLDGIAISASDGVGAFDVSNDGTLVYYSAESWRRERQLVWVDRSGAQEPVIARWDLYFDPRISPDGRRIAFVLDSAVKRDIWVYDIERGGSTRFTRDSSAAFNSIWSPDGKYIYYNVERPAFDIHRRAIDGQTPSEVVIASSSDKRVTSISPDGRTLVYSDDSKPKGDIAVLSTDGDRKPRAYLTTAADEDLAVLSPDGRWMAYESDESGRNEVYLQSYPDPTRVRHQVSTAGGEVPVWTRGGKELVFRALGAEMFMAASVDPQTGQVGAPTNLFPYANVWRLSHSGRDGPFTGTNRFLATRFAPGSAPRQVTVVINWLDELRERMVK